MHSDDEHHEWNADVPSHDSFEERLDHAYDDLDEAMETHKEMTDKEESLWDDWRELVSNSCQAEGLFDPSHADPGICEDLHKLADAYRGKDGASLERPPNPVNKASPHLTAFLCKSPTTVSNLLIAINRFCHDNLETTDHTGRHKLIQWVEGIEAFCGVKASDRFSTHDCWHNASAKEREGVIKFLWGTLQLLELDGCSPGHLPDWKRNRSFNFIGDTHDLLGATQALTVSSSRARSRSPPRDTRDNLRMRDRSPRTSYRDRRDPHQRRDSRSRNRCSPDPYDADMSYSLAHGLLGHTFSTRKARIYGML
ncbi:RHTO0S39e00144g1_1 [Rhodotorula toruloides]|uniref:RHTO0S39e00144g1_1 n=1 Tax=Rhodotorula toruloides TaxID=5286 RepID=A0A061BRX8_RHOTO|nr:RHTO0S39e00144g1_1 [Rhodotorula toruloides]